MALAKRNPEQSVALARGAGCKPMNECECI